MSLIKNYLFLVFLFAIGIGSSDAASIQIVNQNDYEILEKFFIRNLEIEGYDYVLEGNKPIAIHNYYSLHNLYIPKCFELAKERAAETLLMHAAIPLWQKYCSNQKKFVLKAVPLDYLGGEAFGWEVMFINVPILQKMIEENIHLFRYILGPTVTSNQLTERIAYSNETLENVLLDNRVLVGIVLGFGTHNSIVAGRAENIHALAYTPDIFPFASKTLPLQDFKDYYGLYFFESFKPNFINENILLKPSAGFTNLNEELAAIDKLEEALPPSLIEQDPKFIFGASKGSKTNQQLFEKLVQNQKQTQNLLRNPYFLEIVLTKICGEKPIISCKKTSQSSSSISLSIFKDKMPLETWSLIIENVLNSFGKEEEKSAFIKAFSDSSIPLLAPPIVGASRSAIEGIMAAKSNLAHTETVFNTLSNDSSLIEVVPKQLYHKTLKTGKAQELKGAGKVQVNYAVEDLKGNLLYANHNVWLNIIDLFPGLAHGIQNMRIGEERCIYIHPSLAYGDITTLQSCTGLKMTITLLKFESEEFEQMPLLTSLDLSWITNPKIFEKLEESVAMLPTFKGAFYRDIIQEVDGTSVTTVLSETLKAKP